MFSLFISVKTLVLNNIYALLAYQKLVLARGKILRVTDNQIGDLHLNRVCYD